MIQKALTSVNNIVTLTAVGCVNYFVTRVKRCIGEHFNAWHAGSKFQQTTFWNIFHRKQALTLRATRLNSTETICMKFQSVSDKYPEFVCWIVHRIVKVNTLLYPSLHLMTITKTRLYNFDPLKPHFYIVKLGFTGVYIIFLISAQKHRLWVLVRTASTRRF